MAARWSDDENLRLEILWASPRTVKSAINEFPGRTEDALVSRARMMGLGDKVLIEAPMIGKIRELMADGKARHIVEVAKTLEAAEAGVREWMAKLLEDEKVHIESFDGPHRAAMYVWGKGENAERPVPLKAVANKASKKDVEEANDEQVELLMDELYRDRKCSWWPKADPLVNSAFRAMVERRAA